MTKIQSGWLFIRAVRPISPFFRWNRQIASIVSRIITNCIHIYSKLVICKYELNLWLLLLFLYAVWLFRRKSGEIDIRTRNEQPSSLNFCLKIVCIVYWCYLTEIAKKNGGNFNFQSYFRTANLFLKRPNVPGKNVTKWNQR